MENATAILVQANLSITGGSCFLEVAVNDSQVVEVIQPPVGLQCLQLMLSPKGLGTAHVTVYDIGLAPPRAASALVVYLLSFFSSCNLFLEAKTCWERHKYVFFIKIIILDINQMYLIKNGYILGNWLERNKRISKDT